MKARRVGTNPTLRLYIEGGFFLANIEEKVENLVKDNGIEEQLKEILSLDEYIKYDAFVNKKIKKHPIYME